MMNYMQTYKDRSRQSVDTGGGEVEPAGVD